MTKDEIRKRLDLCTERDFPHMLCEDRIADLLFDLQGKHPQTGMLSGGNTYTGVDRSPTPKSRGQEIAEKYPARIRR